MSEHLSSKGAGSFHVVCVSASSLPRTRASLEALGFRIYALDSARVDSKAALLDALAKCFVIDHGGSGPLSSWDAASDLIWQALMERPDRYVAILWKDADVMIADRLQLFLDGLELLYAVSNTLEQQETTEDTHPVLLRVAALGEGRGFPQWS